MSKNLITGCAGFIGFHLCQRLINTSGNEYQIVGLDNLNDYYDVHLKEARLAQLTRGPRFDFVKLDLTNYDVLSRLFQSERFTKVVNLAAQAGVRYSVVHP